MLRVSGVYMGLCIKTNQKYIGSSKNVGKRVAVHVHSLRRKQHYNKRLQVCWDIYGEENFVWSVLEACEEQNLLNREQFYLDRHNAQELLNLSKLARCPESTEAVRLSRSIVAKRQHANKSLGVHTWSEGSRQTAANKAVVTRRARNNYKTPTFEWTPERRERVAFHMKARRAKEREAGVFCVPRQSKYSEEIVARVKEAIRSGERYKDISAREGISFATISVFRNHKRWSHVK